MGLGWAFRNRINDALLVGSLMVVSPLTALGTYYQLLAQVCGLSLLVAQVSLLSFYGNEDARSNASVRARPVIRGIALGILATAQILIYPELLPFILLTYFLWLFFIIIKAPYALTRIAIAGAALLASVIVLARFNIFRMLTLLASRILGQEAAHFHAVGPLHQLWFPFPYFLIPSGLSSLWGFTMLNQYSGPMLMVGIALGIFLTALTAAFGCYRAVKSGDPSAIVLSVMLLLGAVLFVKRVDFGLFKLAMYIQPFLLATLAWIAINPSRIRALTRVACILLLVGGALTQWRYAQTSINGDYGSPSGFVQVRNATPLHLLNRLNEQSNPSEHIGAYLSDTSNYVLGKYETGYVGSKPLFFLTDEFRTNIRAVRKPAIPLFRPAFPKYDAYAKNLLKENDVFIAHARFRFSSRRIAAYSLPVIDDRYKHIALFHDGATDVVLNRSQDSSGNNIVSVKMVHNIRNDPVFLQTSLGYAPGPAPTTKISLFQVEPDYFRQGKTMSGIGRYLLFTILNPTPNDRMLISITDTFSRDGDDRLPPASILGRERVALPLVGDGSARVVSPPVKPLSVYGYKIIGLDMGVRGHLFETPRIGLMNLFGNNIQIDPRLLTGFARNISIISALQYRDMTPPSYFQNLAEGLMDPNLIYSGIYEDGWMSKSAYLKFSSRVKNERFVVNGLVPLIGNPNFKERLTCKIDGRKVKSFVLGVGYFHLGIQAHLLKGAHTVEFQFNSFERLPEGDGRPISARITSIGFVRSINRFKKR